MVTIEYECETDFDLGLDCPALAKMVAEKVLDMEKCPWDAQVNLVLTDNEEIKRVNTEFRGIERATDVLSFPMLPFETPADYSVAEDDESCFDLDSGELLLGDIMISAERAAAQAEEYGHSVKREFCFLVAHSMLHLLGYDHMTPEEAADMEARQAGWDAEAEKKRPVAEDETPIERKNGRGKDKIPPSKTKAGQRKNKDKPYGKEIKTKK